MEWQATKRDKEICAILRNNCDTPRVLFCATGPLKLRRHGSLKSVLLVATGFYTYLIKWKGMSLYVRWINRSLSVTGTSTSLIISGAPVMPVRGRERQREADVESEEFKTVTLEVSHADDVARIVENLTLLIQRAKHTADTLQREEAGVSENRTVLPDSAWESVEVVSETDSSASDEGDAPRTLADQFSLAMLPTGDGNAYLDAQKLLRIAPQRYIAITSLVDGEFADYTTLKNAYMRHEEGALLADLDVFIRGSKSQVEALCELHYPSFIHAAQQCMAISEEDAQMVGKELSGATALVQSAVVEMKQAAASVCQTRTVRDNLVQVRALVQEALRVAEYLETAEAQVQKEQLIGAVSSLHELVRVATPMAEHALGKYVLRMRVPALSHTICRHAIQHFNEWLRLLRDQAQPLGAAALAWVGDITPGSITKTIAIDPLGDHWWLDEKFNAASIAVAPFEKAKVIVDISNGAAIQEVFRELRWAECFSRCYTEARAEHLRSICLGNHEQVEGTPAGEVVGAFERYCATVLGFILIEDLVYNATSPHVQSKTEVLQTWDRIGMYVGERARSVSQSLMADPDYTRHMEGLFRVLRNLVHYAVENVKCVELSPLVLSRVVETLSDNIISLWLQEACMECTDLILKDRLAPVSVTSAEEFETYVAHYYLHRCPSLELPIPSSYTGGELLLPYSIQVPIVGEKASHFLSQCFAIVVMESASAVRQSELNNVDAMLLKYISVLFRTVAESMMSQLQCIDRRSVLQFAVFITSCSAMLVIISCVEQQFMLRWLGDYGGDERQKLGVPKLLNSSAALFAKGTQGGITSLLAACIADVEERLRVTATSTYWKKQAEREDDDWSLEENEGLEGAIEYVFDRIPQLLAILQVTVVRSVIGTLLAHTGTLLHDNMETAITSAVINDQNDFDVLRMCVNGFEDRCTALIPGWQNRLNNVFAGLSAVQRYALIVSSTAEDMRLWIARKEAQYIAAKTNQPPIVAGLGDAGKAVAKGIHAVGKSMAATASALSGPRNS